MDLGIRGSVAAKHRPTAAMQRSHLSRRQLAVAAVLQRPRPAPRDTKPSRRVDRIQEGGPNRPAWQDREQLSGTSTSNRTAPVTTSPADGMLEGISYSSRHKLRDGHVHVFAYGANMSIATLRRRNIQQVVSRDAATVVDPNVRLVFKHRGGYATLAILPPGESPKFQSFDDKLHGVLYQMSQADLEKLEARETGYRLVELKVATYEGHEVDAYVFVSGRMSTLAAEVAPTESYMRKLRQGASDNYLDPEYQAFLSSITTVTSAGLPAAYYDTPDKYLAPAWMLACAAAIVAFFLQHH